MQLVWLTNEGTKRQNVYHTRADCYHLNHVGPRDEVEAMKREAEASGSRECQNCEKLRNAAVEDV